jgi:hypothetical protein
MPRDPVRAFLDEVSKRRPHLAGYLESVEELRFEDSRLTILAPPGDGMLRSRLQQDANRQAVEESLAAIWGPGTAWRLAEGKVRAPAAAETAPASADTGAENPAVQTVLEIFGGRVETIQEHGTYTED